MTHYTQGAYENQTLFMNTLYKITGICVFTTKDEVMRLLFGIHNQDAWMRDELLKNHHKYRNVSADLMQLRGS